MALYDILLVSKDSCPCIPNTAELLVAEEALELRHDGFKHVLRAFIYQNTALNLTEWPIIPR